MLIGIKKRINRKLFYLIKHRYAIESDVTIHPSVRIEGSSLKGHINILEGCKIHQAHLDGKINIGRFTSLWGPDVFVNASIYGISIGSFCSIAKNVSIQEGFHNSQLVTTYQVFKNIIKKPLPTEVISKGPISIGHDVWIGANAIILSGVMIGTGAIIAAGAIVTKDVPSYAIVGGNPAKFIKWRFPEELQKKIFATGWWDWSVEKIKEETAFFSTPASDLFSEKEYK